ncbi:MAG: ABC transporter substrate-binding protein [Epsilonproteobacteria bacterium]|nr:ABC transporter substrate-binding protein [Campylobacterota bacterium]
MPDKNKIILTLTLMLSVAYIGQHASNIAVDDLPISTPEHVEGLQQEQEIYEDDLEQPAITVAKEAKKIKKHKPGAIKKDALTEELDKYGQEKEEDTPPLAFVKRTEKLQQPPPTEPSPHDIPQRQELPIQTKIVSGKTQIPISASLPLKGEISIIGKQLFDGITLFFKKMKKDFKELVFNFHLYALNDSALIPKVRRNIGKMSPHSPLFLSFFGTEVVGAIMPHIHTGELANIFPIEGSPGLRTEQNVNSVYFRASNELELKALIDHSVKVLYKKKFAVFYEASDWGEGAVILIEKILNEHGLKLMAKAGYPARTVNIKQAVDFLSAYSPNAILCIAHARPAYNFIRQVINKGLHQTVFLGLSTLFSIQRPLRRSRGIQLITSSVVPSPFTSKLPIVEEYRKDMQEYLPYKTLSPFSLEGYINAALLCECFKRITLPLNSDKVISILEDMQQENFKGLELNFSAQNRTLSHQVWINIGQKEEWIPFPQTLEDYEQNDSKNN